MSSRFMVIYWFCIKVNIVLIFGCAIVFISCPTNAAAPQAMFRLDNQPSRLEDEKNAYGYIETARFLAYNESYDSALSVLIKAKSLAFDSALLSKCFRIESQIYLRLNKAKDSGVSARRALELLPTICDVNEAVVIQNVLGAVEVFGGNFEQGLLHYHASLKLLEKIEDESKEAVIFTNLGVLFYKMFDYQTAIDFWEQALELDIDLHESHNCQINLALANINLENYGKSKRLIDGLRQRINLLSQGLRVSLYYTMGTYYDSIGNLDSSRVYFEKSYNIAKSNDARHEAENLLSLARIYDKSSQVDKAEQFLNLSEEISRMQNFPDVLLRCSAERIRLSKLKGDLFNQIDAQDEYSERRKRFYDMNLSNIAAAQKQIWRRQKHAKKLSTNQANLEATSALANVHAQLQITILIVGLMIFVLTLLLLYHVQMRIKHKTALERAVETRISHCERKNKTLMEIVHVAATKKQEIEAKLQNASSAFDEYHTPYSDASHEIFKPLDEIFCRQERK